MIWQPCGKLFREKSRKTSTNFRENSGVKKFVQKLARKNEKIAKRTLRDFIKMV